MKGQPKSTLALRDALTQELFPLTKSHTLIGNSSQCDICIKNNSVSHFQSFLVTDENEITTIQDLCSVNGTYINGTLVKSPMIINIGDTLKIGDVIIEVQEYITDESFLNLNSYVQNINYKSEEKIYIPTKESENQILIDDEYCDIIFQEESFNPLSNSPINKVIFDSYIETDSIEQPFNIIKENESDCLMITTLISGNILEQTYLPLSDGQYFAHGSKQNKNNILIDVLDKKQKLSFIEIKDGSIHTHKLEGFEQNDNSIGKSQRDKILIYTNKTYQVFIQVSKAPDSLIRIPLLSRDKDFVKETAKVFCSIMIPMFLLLFVDINQEKEKKKELSIIYKKETKTEMNDKKHASKDPEKTNKNDAHKKTDQNKKKVANSKKGDIKKSQKSQKVASQPTPKKPAKAKAPVKAYELKMDANIDSMFASEQVAKADPKRSPASLTSKSALNGSLDTKVSNSTRSDVGNLGSDLSGSDKSFGAKGLSGKKGMDTSYIQTETVVLGSMDPELLRKILQQYLPQFKHCYQQELAYNSEDIKGIVDLNFEIKGDGKVAKINIKAKDQRFSTKGINCMTNVLSIIDFPKPKGGGTVAVRQPLNFFSEKSQS